MVNSENRDIPHIITPKNFLWGTAISEYQVSGMHHCPNSNWAVWENSTHKNGTSRIAHGSRSGSACDFKNRYPSYIELMKELGTNAFRFSVEWSNIEPQPGIFCELELQYYENLCDRLIAAGIRPSITLHHFTDPIWFTQKGGFEKEENSAYFVRFCQKVFERLGKKVDLWTTLNEPTIYMFQGYIRGKFPPGKKNPFLAIKVMGNLLNAHVQAYQALKKMPYGDTALIGIVHQYLMFYPYHTWHPVERIPGMLYNDFMNHALFDLFTTGTFAVKIPFLFKYEYKVPHDNQLLDFIGLNYYSRVLVKNQLNLAAPFISAGYPHEVMTDMPYAIYPQGLYHAVKEVSSLKVPIYITENGIADKRDDRRESFIKEYVQQMGYALRDGYDIRGYFYWSLMDNFEWDEGHSKKFGLCHVDFETKVATIREGAKMYADIIAKSCSFF